MVTMALSRAFLFVPAFLGAAMALAQDKPLNIGDPAPAMKPEGWVKGAPIKSFEKGKVYVVEFWATWCGPCIQSMPHLSDMADKWKGKVEFISVNTWDRNDEGEKTAGNKAHVDRVKKFVDENNAKMRYTIALDDEKDTISTTWMRAAGRNGIPCAFVVNQEGQVAWIGHPMQMEKPVEEIFNKTYDIQAFKKTFDEAAAKARAEMQLSKDLTAAAKAGDMAKFEAMVAKLPGDKADQFRRAFSSAAGGDPEFAFKYLQANMTKLDDIDATTWCSMLSYVVLNSTSEATRNKALELSADCTAKCPDASKAIAYAYHARSLAKAGKADEAKTYIGKAKAAVASFEPAEQREGITKFIEGIEKGLGK